MSQKKKEYPDGGDEIWNLEHYRFLAGSEDLKSQPEELEDSELPSSSKSTPMPKQSCETTSQESPSIPISEPTTQKEESLTASGEDSPVPKPVSREQGKDLTGNPVAWVENNSESSPQSDQNSPSSSSLQELSILDYERFLADSEWQAIKAKLKSSRRRSWVRDTEGSDYSLFPTLTSNSGRNSRPAGQNKLEQWLKHSSLILAGSQLNSHPPNPPFKGGRRGDGLSFHMVRGDVSTGPIPREHFSTPTNTLSRIRARYLLGRSVTPAQAAVALRRVKYLNQIRR